MVSRRLTPLNLLNWRSDRDSKIFCSLCVHTKVIVKGELVVVPDLNGEFRRNLCFSLVQTPEVILHTQTDFFYMYNIFSNNASNNNFSQ